MRKRASALVAVAGLAFGREAWLSCAIPKKASAGCIVDSISGHVLVFFFFFFEKKKKKRIL